MIKHTVYKTEFIEPGIITPNEFDYLKLNLTNNVDFKILDGSETFWKNFK